MLFFGSFRKHLCAVLFTVSLNKLGLLWPINVSDEVEFMRYLCHSILAGCIIIRFCRAWRDADLPSESGSRAVVSAEPQTRAECASSFHVSTGRTLVLTIRPRGPMFVFTAFRYCSVAKFDLGGIYKQYRKACCVCVRAWDRLCVCVCV